MKLTLSPGANGCITSWLRPCPSPDMFSLMELFVWRPWHTWAAKPNVRLGWVKRSPGRPLSWPVKTCSCKQPCWAPDMITSKVFDPLHFQSLSPFSPFLFLFLFSYLFSSNLSTYSISLFSFFLPCCHTLSPPVFSIYFLSCSIFSLHSSLKPWQL